MKYIKTLAIAAFIGSTISVFSQTTFKTATLVPFIDLNNNCIKDGGEVNMQNGWRFMPKVRATYQRGFSGEVLGANRSHDAGSPTFGGSYTSPNCKDTLAGSFAFASPLYAAATNSFDLWTWDYEQYLQPCFNPNGIAFNTLTYVPFKSTIVGRELTFTHKQIVAHKNNNFNIGFKGASVCKTDSVYFFLWANTSSIVCPTATIPHGTFPATCTVKSDGVTIDTHTYNLTYSAPNVFLQGTNSSISLAGHDAVNFIKYVYLKPAFLNAYTLGSHTVTIIHTPPYGMTQPITQDFEFIVTNNCSQVTGYAFVDCNNNCVKDGTEGYTGQQISSLNLLNSTNQFIIYPNSLGNYNFSSIVPGIYTVSPQAIVNFSICSPASYTLNINPSSSYNVNYGVKQTTVLADDFKSFLSLSNANPGPGAVPGGTITVSAYNYKTGGNLCTAPVLPAKLKVVIAPLMSYINVVGSTPVPSSVIPSATGDTIVWNNPLPNDLHQFTVYTATNAVIGNQYCIKSIIYPLTDGNPLNNTYTRCRNFGGPFDPNAKYAEATNMDVNGDVPPNTTELIYTVLFQNLGNGPAVNVLIKDTIDSNLNLSTLEVIGFSSPVKTQVNNTNREVSFKFDDICLSAASVNEPASHGFVQYKIKLNNGLPVGTQFRNRAHIYFDYNSAVSTNQVITNIFSPTGLSNLVMDKNSVLVYPNPFTTNITVYSASEINTVVVYDMLGKVVLTLLNTNSKEVLVDMSTVSKGFYVMKISTNSGELTKKIVKE